MLQRILIIDDDEQLADAYKIYLSKHGYCVHCAHELEEAEALLAHYEYSLVITDLRLSKLGFGGLEIVKQIREKRLPTHIVVFTGYAWPELKAEALAQNVDAFVRKPAKLSDLMETISTLTEASA